MTADILSSIAAELRVEVSRLEAQALGSLRDPMNLGGVVAVRTVEALANAIERVAENARPAKPLRSV
ncbi:hypothetical protein GCM10007036_07810 [Alsobacter metallidurans]|uniref:Uncharacterized protein n=1 Tax=Alsobacter metallidurans TaxID=340221 RepID=A0A917I467_9HYPH|nr:hypothetical protein [Alsobacter metallidurans]GGH10995.1 hypothetical protein GCM10007036_07810 [Alsobacter metallidurans]